MIKLFLAGVIGVSTGPNDTLICYFLNLSTVQQIKRVIKNNSLSVHNPFLLGPRSSEPTGFPDLSYKRDLDGAEYFLFPLNDKEVEIRDQGSGIRPKVDRVNQALTGSAELHPIAPNDNEDLYWLGLISTKNTDKFARVRSSLKNLDQRYDSFLISRLVIKNGVFKVGDFPIREGRSILLRYGTSDFRPGAKFEQAACVTPHIEFPSGSMTFSFSSYSNPNSGTHTFRSSPGQNLEFVLLNTEYEEILQTVVSAPQEYRVRLYYENMFYEKIIENGELEDADGGIGPNLNFQGPNLPKIPGLRRWINPNDNGASPPMLISCRPKYLL